MKFDDYSLKITMKACMMYEQITGKNFFLLNTEEDAVYLMYCAFCVNNNQNITFNAFLILLEEKKVSVWFTEEYKRIGEFMAQFHINDKSSDDVEEEDNNKRELPNLTDTISALIFQYHLDINYVMEKMDLWEIMIYMKSADSQYKMEMEEKRLFTYIQVLPHIDGKKCKSPDKLLPFPWEKMDRKKRAEDELKKNEFAIKNTIGMKLNI